MTLADSLRALRQAANDVERAIDTNGALALPVGEIEDAVLYESAKIVLAELHRRALNAAATIQVEPQQSDAQRAAGLAFSDATTAARSLFYALLPYAEPQR